jgi:hypothetical protein
MGIKFLDITTAGPADDTLLIEHFLPSGTATVRQRSITSGRAGKGCTLHRENRSKQAPLRFCDAQELVVEQSLLGNAHR